MTREDALTPTRRDLLLRIARGESAAEIAAARGVSRFTIRNQRADLRRMFEARSSVQLIRAALLRGVLTVRDLEQPRAH